MTDEDRDLASREVDGGTPELAYSSDAMHIVDPKQGTTGNDDKPQVAPRKVRQHRKETTK